MNKPTHELNRLWCTIGQFDATIQHPFKFILFLLLHLQSYTTPYVLNYIFFVLYIKISNFDQVFFSPNILTFTTSSNKMLYQNILHE
jgi:hypothetical protein